eukprot:1738520-Pyramimonas_sp.AAC.1
MARMFLHGPQNVAQRLSVHVKLVRGLRGNRSWEVIQCVRALPRPSLSVDVESGVFRDSQKFFQEMGRLQASMLQRELRGHLERGGAPDDGRS